MGIFDRFKKSNESANRGNSAPQMKNTQLPSDPQITRFYQNCVEDYHNAAKEKSLATKGIINIPELIPIGEQAVLTFLKDPFFQSQFGGNPSVYYYVIMSLSIQAGIVFAAKWHDNASALTKGYVERIIREGPAESCKPWLYQLGLTDNQKENTFYQVIFERWAKNHEPYWKLKDCRDYTFNATLAAYQLGVSMILERCGY